LKLGKRPTERVTPLFDEPPHDKEAEQIDAAAENRDRTRTSFDEQHPDRLLEGDELNGVADDPVWNLDDLDVKCRVGFDWAIDDVAHNKNDSGGELGIPDMLSNARRI
jgi:hypothetical protein